MSCTTCGDVKKQCPARMNDGRTFTDYSGRYHSHMRLMNEVVSSGQVQSAYESRMYLQKNGDRLIAQDRERAIANMAPCAPCGRPANSAGTMLPERYVIKCDAVSCSRREVDPNGLGDGVALGNGY